MFAHLNSFGVLQETLENLEMNKTKIKNIYLIMQKKNTILIKKIKECKQKLEIYKHNISFTKVLNNSVSNFITLYILSFSKDIQNLENEYKQNIKYCNILQKKLSSIHISITKTKLKIIIQS